MAGGRLGRTDCSIFGAAGSADAQPANRQRTQSEGVVAWCQSQARHYLQVQHIQAQVWSRPASCIPSSSESIQSLPGKQLPQWCTAAGRLLVAAPPDAQGTPVTHEPGAQVCDSGAAQHGGTGRHCRRDAQPGGRRGGAVRRPEGARIPRHPGARLLRQALAGSLLFTSRRCDIFAGGNADVAASANASKRTSSAGCSDIASRAATEGDSMQVATMTAIAPICEGRRGTLPLLCAGIPQQGGSCRR